MAAQGRLRNQGDRAHHVRQLLRRVGVPQHPVGGAAGAGTWQAAHPHAAPEDDGCSAVNWIYSGRHTNKCDEPSRNAPMLRLRWPFLGESYLLI